MGLRALLIWPEFPYSYWSYRETNRMLAVKALTPPLGLITAAAMLPPEWELRLVDMNTRKLQEDDWDFADLVLMSAMIVQQGALLELVREAKGRGKTVVVGGPYVTSIRTKYYRPAATMLFKVKRKRPCLYCWPLWPRARPG